MLSRFKFGKIPCIYQFVVKFLMAYSNKKSDGRLRPCEKFQVRNFSWNSSVEPWGAERVKLDSVWFM